MVLKVDAFLGDLADFRQGKHLVAAGVGQDRPVPAHEPVQPAEVAHHVQAGPDEQVVRVPEDHLRAQFAQLGGTHRFHGPLRADRHEGGRADDAVGRRQPTAPGEAAGLVGGEEFKHGGLPLAGLGKSGNVPPRGTTMQTVAQIEAAEISDYEKERGKPTPNYTHGMVQANVTMILAGKLA